MAETAAAEVATATETAAAPTVGATETKPVETSPVVTKTALTMLEGGKDEGKPDESEATAEIVYDFKAPEGFELDPEAISAFTEFAKAEKLPSDVAQRIVEYGLKRQADIASAQSKVTEDRMLKEEAEAIEVLRKDPLLGGANFEQTLKLASEGFKKFASPDEMAFINATRLGNRVEMITIFRKVALAMKEDGISAATTRPGTPDDSTVLQDLYPEMFKTKE